MGNIITYTSQHVFGLNVDSVLVAPKIKIEEPKKNLVRIKPNVIRGKGLHALLRNF